MAGRSPQLHANPTDRALVRYTLMCRLTETAIQRTGMQCGVCWESALHAQCG